MELGQHAERTAWQAERQGLLDLVRTLTAPRPPMLVQLVDAMWRRLVRTDPA